MSRTSRCCKICCGVVTLFIIILLVVLIVLFTTILKPKQPKILAHDVIIQDFEYQVLPAFKLNVSLGLVVTIKNPNYGSFKYKNGTASVYYHEEDIAAVQMEDGEIPARGTKDISTSVLVIADKLILNPSFVADLLTGCFNFTSSSTIHGKASLFKIMKTHATAITDCNIFFCLNQTTDSTCYSKMKI